MTKKIVIASLAFLTLVLPAPAQVLGPYVPPSNAITPEAKSDSQPPMQLAERIPIEKPLVLRPASEGARDQLDALEAWNKASNRPTRIGFSRPLPEPITAVFGSSSVRAESAAQVEPHAVRATTGAGSVVWATKVTILGAYGIRLHLVDVHLPAGTRFWTYCPDGRAIGFGLELLSPFGDIWTPTVFGESVFFEVELPAGGRTGAFSIAELSQLVAPDQRLASSIQHAQDNICLIDAACATSSDFDQLGPLERAVAFLIFIKNGAVFGCTGTLLNDTATSGIPYLLTANHCISNQGEASSLEAFWDYRASSCNGPLPSPSSLPRSSGGVLLASGPSTDFAFLQLSADSATANRPRMGWDPRPSSLQPGTLLYRVSHPLSFSQGFSISRLENVGATCGSSFISSSRFVGGDSHGSSGAAAVLQGGYVVGQLRGVCSGPDDACDNSTIRRDGAFSQTYPLIAQWLRPGGSPQPCVSNATTLCLNAGRFRVTASWQTTTASGVGNAVPITSDTGYFWFFSSNNVEAIIKVLNACSFAAAPRYWVFAAGLTNVNVTITVTDTQTGAVKFYQNPLNTAFQPIQDTAAFATCP